MGFLGSKFSVLSRITGCLVYDELQLACAAHRRTLNFAMRELSLPKPHCRGTDERHG